MSHGRAVARVTAERFPRVSGDEPALKDGFAAQRVFSPRERG